ncbi:AT-rich interactive domain-containing protein 1B [Drosophila bipectinata]|uniref:AT-rich interactive domain-containing protein 1B n=1 Tax=Drosophila bipectinata TaxID=42026 RepID=UPI0038B2912B
MWFHAPSLSSSIASTAPPACLRSLLPLLQWLRPIVLLALLPSNVTARFCEGCSQGCCTQGCCPPYQGGPRPLPPPSEHVLNLFFISHWFFWCVVVAIILAILCAYSLWKKRRTLCGWGFNEHHTQSEGDSAGSCYAPPQYSRCNSFHHPPPPYTEVTSKPDLYPLVFTCNSDAGNGKGNGSSSYLMVQYFRNYIVRPAAGGSLSAASTVDSLSSSFICNANEANTLVPPPYSRAASPELGLHHYVAHAHAHNGHLRSLDQQQHQQQQQLQHQHQAAPMATVHYSGMPRSASQLVDADAYQPRMMMPAQAAQHYATVALGTSPGGGALYSTRLHASHDEGMGVGGGVGGGGGGGYLQSQSDQHFRYLANSSSSLSDIFVNNSCVAGMLPESLGGGGGGGGAGGASQSTESGAATQAASLNSLAMGGGVGGMGHGSSGGLGTPVIYSNGCIQPNPLHSLENCCQPSAQASGVSSLANIGTPGSPPQATSPTGEVREILDQIRQLQAGVSYEQLLLNGGGGGAGGASGGVGGGGAKPRLQHTLSTPSNSQQTMPTMQPILTTSASSGSGKSKKFFSTSSSSGGKTNKALYIPMAAIGGGSGGGSGAQRCVLKSPVSSVVSGASFFVNRGRVARKGWITRSAPTTPGSALPPNRLGDDSPLLLNEHDEDAIDDDEEPDEEEEDDDEENRDEDMDTDTDMETEAMARNHHRQQQQRHHRQHRHHRRQLE